MAQLMTSKCGTYAGWNHHMRYNTPVCDACNEAKKQYQREHQRTTPKARQANKIVIKAGLAAKRELAARHPKEYRKLYERFKKQLAGIDGA